MRRLWLVNLALFALVLLTGFTLRQRWMEARVREEALLKQMVPVPPAPSIPPIPAVAAATPAAYVEVAQRMVFSRDRNPNVILDPPAPPPPPKPMPALPVAYGVMNLGDEPLVILAEKAGTQHCSYRAGQRIGEFKLVAMNNQEIVFEWEGKYVRKRLEELADRTPTIQAQAAPPATTQQSPAAAPAATNLGDNKKAGPGTDLGNETRACIPGDATPAGTVQDGFRKTVTKTPFGDSCRWEPVK